MRPYIPQQIVDVMERNLLSVLYQVNQQELMNLQNQLQQELLKNQIFISQLHGPVEPSKDPKL